MKGTEDKIENFVIPFCRNPWYASVLKLCTDLMPHSEKTSEKKRSRGGPQKYSKQGILPL